MPFQLGPTELIIILVIIILLFGAGRIGKIAGELGSSVRAFRQAVRQTDQDEQSDGVDQP